jgi:hypothetical protein
MLQHIPEQDDDFTFPHRNLQVKVSKCDFLKYLGFIVGDGELKVDPASVTPVFNCASPKNLLQLRVSKQQNFNQN